MKKWEDIFKDKMEGFEKPLPESVFTEFQARLNGAAVPSAPKRLRWGWALIPAVAAGLAVFLLPRHPQTPVTGGNTTGPHSVEVINTESDIIAEANVAEVVAPPERMNTKPVVVAAEVALVAEPVEIQAEPEAESQDDIPLVVNDVTKEKETPSTDNDSPFIPDKAKVRTTKKADIVPAAGIIGGGGLVAALATPYFARHEGLINLDQAGSKPHSDQPVYSTAQDPQETNNNPVKDVLAGRPHHNLPLKVGLSTRIPVSGRFGLTTGVEYSMYSSTFTYTLSGDKKQIAHYVGIPVRLDWTFISTGWLDAYLGAGVSGDVCVGATLGGEKFKRDGLTVSLLGAGGVQFNVARNVGLYLEPELSWTIPSDAQVLRTYRSDHSVMYSVSGGLRINLGK